MKNKNSDSLKSYNPRKSKKHIFFFNVLPVALAAAVLLGIAGNSAFRSVDATAKTSLPYIETKKSILKSGGTFNILEVTPKSDNPLYGTSAGGVLTTQYGSGDASEENYGAVTGNFGYLIDGQEPIDFDKTLGNFSAQLITGDKTNTKNYKDSNDLYDGINFSNIRSSWANAYLKDLESDGIASENEDSAPLKLNKTADSYYKELMPWENDEKGEKTVNLTTTETYYVKGSFTENTENGSFSASSSSFVVNKGGNYVQNISLMNQLSAVTDEGSSGEDSDLSNLVFYKPEFTKVDFEKIDVNTVKDKLYKAEKIGFPLIFKKTKAGTEDNSTAGAGQNNVYTVDLYATGDFNDLLTTDETKLSKAIKQHAFDDTCDYYVITGLEENPIMGSALTNGTSDKTLDQMQKSGGYYSSQLDIEKPFVSTQQLVIKNKGFDENPAKGFFNCDPKFFTYVGKGNGSYDLNVTPTTAGDNSSNTYIINTNLIRYVGGYTNNNWFLKHSLDLDDKEADSLASRVYVKCVTPEEADSESLDSYDLIVLSNGVSFFSGKSDGSFEKADCGNLVNNLQVYLNDKKPLLLDSRALSNSQISNLLSTKEEKDNSTYKYMDMGKKDKPYGAAYRNVYIFRDGFDGGKKVIASDNYTKQFPSDQYKGNDSAFKDVYEGISYENSLRERKTPGTSDLIDDTIDEAAAIRYIINYQQQRSTAKKSKIKVLDIEPESINATNSADGYKYYKVSSGKVEGVSDTSFDTAASKHKIMQCLTGYDEKNVDVTTVSTRTLDGLTDDITETYDLIYIGDNGGLRKKYNDSSMNYPGNGDFQNSLVYYNIGDTYQVSNTNYATLNGMLDKEYNTTAGSNDTYRYSGNDISVKKQSELQSFINQKFPVIISDGLINDTSNGTSNINVGISFTEGKFNKGNDQNSDTVTVTVNPVFYQNGIPVKINNAKCTYSWYKYENNNLTQINNESGSTITLKNDVIPYRDWDKAGDYRFLCYIDSITIGDQKVVFSYKPSIRIGVWHNKANGDRGGGAFYDTYTVSNNYRDNTSNQMISIPALNDSAISLTTVDHNTRLYDTLNRNIITSKNVMSYSSAIKNVNLVESYASLSSPEIKMLNAPKQYKDENNTNQITDKKLDFDFKIINETDVNPQDTTYTAKVYADLNSDGVYNPETEEITSLTVNKAGGGSVLPANLKGGIAEDSAQEYKLSAQLPESLQGAFSWKFVITQNSDDSVSTDDCPKDSYKGISFVGLNDPKSKIRIRILQLNSAKNEPSKNNKGETEDPKNKRSEGSNHNQYNLEQIMNTKEGVFGTALTNKFITDNYDIKIRTISATDFANYINNGTFKSYIQNNDANWYDAHKNSNFKWTDYYDMLILGFGDSYQGPDDKGLKLVNDFITTGKAVLFCHDNSSYRNLSKSYYKAFKKDADFTNAFYYNTMLRSKAFMDVYGISDSENVDGLQIGGQKNWELGYNSGVLAQGGQLSSDVQNQIKSRGYSVAYKPISGSDDSQIVSEVHGFSDTATGHRIKLENGIMKSISDDNTNIKDDKGGLVTSKVSQVNKGQITSYPYNVNLNDFNTTSTEKKNGFVYTGNNTNQMSVSNTHAQWYQLNTNANNIVVWYTVENKDSKNDLYGINDCINNYYIYNCGNITYTGAGHEDNDSKVTKNEAELFVNTMIAAFRTSVTKPIAKFVASDNSDTAIESTSIQVESEDTSSDGTITDNQKQAISKKVDEAKIYFKITDNSINKNMTEGITLYDKVVKDRDGKITSKEGKINDWEIGLHDAHPTNIYYDTVSNGQLKRGKVYYFTLPTSSQAYKDLTSGSESGEIWLEPYNTVDGNKQETGDPIKLTISLDKGGLFKLG